MAFEKKEPAQAEKMIQVRFNVATSICLDLENHALNLRESTFPKLPVRNVSVESGKVIEIPESVYNQFKDTERLVPNGKRGHLNKAQDMLQGFEAKSAGAETMKVVKFCEKVAS